MAGTTLENMDKTGTAKDQAWVELVNVSRHYTPDVLAVNQLSLSLKKGEILALLGPSGCGKSTTLKLIAGLETPDSGHISLQGKLVAGSNNWMAPNKRKVAMVFQDYALFPHMTVEQNIRYPLVNSKLDKQLRVKELLSVSRLEQLGQRYPHELSGGQQQRVALARALAQDPEVILLDEPFSNLDARLRESTREEVKSILSQTRITSILVTHDQKEAFSMADRVGVMFDGTIAQLGSPRDIYLHPATKRCARFVGATRFVSGTAQAGVVHCILGKLPLYEQLKDMEGSVEVLIRPDMLSLTENPEGIAHLEQHKFYGSHQLAQLSLAGGLELEVKNSPAEEMRIGSNYDLSVNGSVMAYPHQAV